MTIATVIADLQQAIADTQAVIAASSPAPVPAPAPAPAPAPSADANADWLRRSTAPGVVVAEGFDTIDDWAKCSLVEPPCNPAYQVMVGGKLCGCRSNAWDQNVRASGNGSVRFDILSQSVQGGGGDVVVPFGDYATSQFGPGDDMWVSWRQRMDARFIQGYAANGGGFANAKQVIIAQGDMPPSGSWNGRAGACSEAEIVVVSSGPAYQPCYPTGYIECGAYTGFTQKLNAGQYAGNAGGSTVYTVQNARTAGGLYTCIDFPHTLDRSGCFTYVADEWITYMVHVKMGPVGTAISSVTNSSKPGFINSTYELFAAYPGQDFQLLHHQEGIVIPRGQHYVSGDPALNSSYSGGWNPGTAHPQAKYGALWLTPYMTDKDATQVTQTASTWYDEIIVSRQRISAPGFA